jgi:hypothetical protein
MQEIQEGFGNSDFRIENEKGRSELFYWIAEVMPYFYNPVSTIQKTTTTDMQEVFNYPISYPSWWMDYYYMFTWMFGMLILALGWAVFFRYGKFTYGVDLGCLWKSTVLILLTTVSLGIPNYYNTRFVGEHGVDGDSIKISSDRLRYLDRKGSEKELVLADITTIYQELITYNPPPKIFIVTAKGAVRDSMFITTNLPGYKRFLADLSKRTGVAVKLR